jgi:hypothetical protein
MNTPPLRVADVFRARWTEYRNAHSVPVFQLKTIGHMLACRTAALGGHLWHCPHCGHEAVLHNSCRDRHCPTCQGAAREAWLRKRMKEVLPVPYFHVVFTLPHALNPLIAHNRKELIGLFFREVNATLQEFARDPQWRLEGQLGFLAVLHTWSQTLGEHLHLHCAVPGGAWRASAKPPSEAGRKETGQWIKNKRNWLFRAEALADRFRNRYLKALARLLKKGKLCLPEGGADWLDACSRLSRQRWIAYAKQPFAGPQQVLEYLGRYTHKVAISDYRILSLENGQVTFRYRDRQAGDVEKTMTLAIPEFIRRFLLHILPPGLQKIRFYGWMARTVRRENLRLIRAALALEPPKIEPRVLPAGPLCPRCQAAHMLRPPLLENARAPPQAA